MDSPYHYLEKIEDLKEEICLARQAVKDAILNYRIGTAAELEAAGIARDEIVRRCEAEIRRVYPLYLEEVARQNREKEEAALLSRRTFFNREKGTIRCPIA